MARTRRAFRGGPQRGREVAAAANAPHLNRGVYRRPHNRGNPNRRGNPASRPVPAGRLLKEGMRILFPAINSTRLSTEMQ